MPVVSFTNRRYTHNPYACAKPAPCNKQVADASAAAAPAAPSLADNQVRENYIDSLVQSAYELSATHQATLHRALIGHVSFIAYPTESLDESFFEGQAPAPSADADAKDPMRRIFIGQLPYRVTEMQLQWMFRIFALGAQIYSPERITKKSKTIGATRVPTGCIHAHLRESCLKAVVQNMHKRLLVDDSGIWFARTDAEKDSLDAYVELMKQDPRRRFVDRPYDSLVVQEANSSFQAPNPRWVSNTPELERFAQTLPPAHAAANAVANNAAASRQYYHAAAVTRHPHYGQHYSHQQPAAAYATAYAPATAAPSPYYYDNQQVHYSQHAAATLGYAPTF